MIYTLSNINILCIFHSVYMIYINLYIYVSYNNNINNILQRARKPQAAEKEALNIAFVASPIVSIVAPTFTKDVALIWWINALVTSISYGYGYATIG